MNEQENVRVVQQGYSYYKSGDIQSLLGLFSPDIEWLNPKLDNVPFSGKKQGHTEVLEFFSSIPEYQEVISFEPWEFIAQGDRVVVLGHYEWRMKETGKTFGADWAHAFTLRDGKVTRFQEYSDTAAIAAAYPKPVAA